MAAYTKAHLDELASTQYPHWIPIRHALGIETFGMNAYRRNTGEAVVPEHDESDGGAPELFYVATGARRSRSAARRSTRPPARASGSRTPTATRTATANADDTLVLAIGGARARRGVRPGRLGGAVPRGRRLGASLSDGAAGPGGPAGLQNPYGRVTHG